MTTITGTFSNAADAQSAVEELMAKGWTRDAISVLTPQEESEQPSQTRLAVKDAEKGAVIGGLAGLFVGLSEFAVPGVGPILIGGWIAATLMGAGMGAAAGGVGGVLAEAGVSLEHAHHLAERVHGGETLVIVHTSAMSDPQVAAVLSRHQATQIQESAVS